MPDEPDKRDLVYLRRLEEKVDRLSEDMRDVKTRLTGVEESIVGMHRRIDRVELDRIEKRVDLTEAPR
jgi:hypothetical protein